MVWVIFVALNVNINQMNSEEGSTTLVIQVNTLWLTNLSFTILLELLYKYYRNIRIFQIVSITQIRHNSKNSEYCGSQHE